MAADGPLYRKFHVERIDGTDQPGGKHECCEYFVLDLDHDPHAAPALRAYAASCEESEAADTDRPGGES